MIVHFLHFFLQANYNGQNAHHIFVVNDNRSTLEIDSHLKPRGCLKVPLLGAENRLRRLSTSLILRRYKEGSTDRTRPGKRGHMLPFRPVVVSP